MYFVSVSVFETSLTLCVFLLPVSMLMADQMIGYLRGLQKSNFGLRLLTMMTDLMTGCLNVTSNQNKY